MHSLSMPSEQCRHRIPRATSDKVSSSQELPQAKRRSEMANPRDQHETPRSTTVRVFFRYKEVSPTFGTPFRDVCLIRCYFASLLNNVTWFPPWTHSGGQYGSARPSEKTRNRRAISDQSEGSKTRHRYVRREMDLGGQRLTSCD
jgi:hypothetical protein